MESRGKEVLFIGYNHNYIESVKATLHGLKFTCDTIVLNKNIDAPVVKGDKSFNEVFKLIKSKLKNKRNIRVVLDIPNLCLESFKNTNTLIDYFKSKNSKLLLMYTGDRSKFIKVLGEDNYKIAIDKKLVVFCGKDSTVKDNINKVIY